MSSRLRPSRLAVAPLLVIAGLLVPTAALAHPADAVVVEVRAEVVTVTDGPTDQYTDVKIDTDLYVPDTATAANPAPVVLLAHGFGGNKTGYTALAQQLAHNGYVVMTYSSRGFGDSSHEIGLDSIHYDVKDVSQLIDHLATIPEVLLDAPGDPRIGMHGDSYGGGISLQAAAYDDRLDAIAPRITWSSLVYSLAPNNLGAKDASPYDQPFGVFKQQWTTVFFGLGSAQPVIDNNGDLVIPPTSECPGFVSGLCETYLRINAQGRGDQAAVDLLQESSPDISYDTIDIPTFIIQGENDTLFNLREAYRNYSAVKANGAPVKMLWFNGGHSGSGAAGESKTDVHPDDVMNQRLLRWWDRYLKGDTAVDTGPEFEWYRPWVSHDDTNADTAIEGSATGYPAFPEVTLFLSGGGGLLEDLPSVVAGTLNFVNPPGGQPGAFSETAVRAGDQTPREIPGQNVLFQTEPLTRGAELVGLPEVTVQLASLTGEAQLFAKLYDVSPTGGLTLIRQMASAMYVEDLSAPITFTMTGFAHRFEVGHRIRLVLAATDLSYSNRALADTYSVVIDPAVPATFTAPIRFDGAPTTTPEPAPAPTATPEPAPQLPTTGGGLALVGLSLAGAALGTRARRGR